MLVILALAGANLACKYTDFVSIAAKKSATDFADFRDSAGF